MQSIYAYEDTFGLRKQCSRDARVVVVIIIISNEMFLK